MSEGARGRIPSEMFGGPLDGTKYADLPDLGGPYTDATLCIPLGQPADENPKAVYVCRGDAPVAGFWQFFYIRTDDPATIETPAATRVHAAAADVATQIALARAVAVTALANRTDKAGVPMIAHATRVAARFDPNSSPVEHCVAWLHSVLRDTSLSPRALRAAGIDPKVVDLVTLLTRRPGTDRTTYYHRIAEAPAARAVKMADLDDDLRGDRLRLLERPTRERLLARYTQARKTLLEAVDA